MNIYNRPFDDQDQVRIKLETIAIFGILKLIKEKRLLLINSFILDFENNLNPYDDARMEIERLLLSANKKINPSEGIKKSAKGYCREGIKPRDAFAYSVRSKGRGSLFYYM